VKPESAVDCTPFAGQDCDGVRIAQQLPSQWDSTLLKSVGKADRKMAQFGSAGTGRMPIRSTSEVFPHYRERRDGNMIASVLEVKKEIPV
jgi:hypothetical protein